MGRGQVRAVAAEAAGPGATAPERRRAARNAAGLVVTLAGELDAETLRCDE